MSTKKINPGINPKVIRDHFEYDEDKIINLLGTKFYVTNGGTEFSLGDSTYRYCFIKFADDMSKQFGLTSELIVLFSPFDTFEPRTLDALDVIESRSGDYRLDPICAFIISKDTDFSKKLESSIKTNKESRVIIPFSYQELLNSPRDNIFTERIRKHFFERDLFNFASALRKDIYFFGRENLCNELVDQHLTYENSGVFGLRRSGKTSILFSVSRTLKRRGISCAIIDCESLSTLRWWDALYYVVQATVKDLNIKHHIHRDKYTEFNASIQTEEDLYKLKNKVQNKFLIVFDEIENITFGVSSSERWKSGEDYLKFWNIIRSIYQKQDSPITVLIAGTNPRCVEKPFVTDGVDNPLYKQLNEYYIESFNVTQTKQMVQTLAKYMGLSFQEEIYTYLTRDYGGHPFLIRQVCSHINKEVKSKGQSKINRTLYQNACAKFNSSTGHSYCELIIGVLSTFYPAEYEMLTYLAIGDETLFSEIAKDDLDYIKHLFGYGLIEETDGQFDFKIDLIKDYLKNKFKYKKINLSNQEKLAEISYRRNIIEPKLRKLVMQQLMVKYGEPEAKRQILNKHDQAKKRKFSTLTYRELFDPNLHEIYFDDLRELIRKNYEDCFKNIFSENVEKFNSFMVIINSIGRSDAHAKVVEDHEMQSFRGAMEWLEGKVELFT